MIYLRTESLEGLVLNEVGKNQWVYLLNDILPKYDIGTLNSVAMFLAQCSHESAGFTRLEENLNYSSTALLRVFGKYFKNRDVNEYHRQPEKIANLVYADRMGNGPPESGDGWRYRGRGLIQLTGKTNYSNFAKYIERSLPETVAYLSTKQGALESACWFWHTNNLNKYAYNNDLRNCTIRINGGLNGYEHRKQLYELALDNLDSKFIDNDITDIKLGDRNHIVRDVQEALGITADGIFGPKTGDAIKYYLINRGKSYNGYKFNASDIRELLDAK